MTLTIVHRDAFDLAHALSMYGLCPWVSWDRDLTDQVLSMEPGDRHLKPIIDAQLYGWNGTPRHVRVLTGRLGGAIVVHGSGNLAPGWFEDNLPPSPLTLWDPGDGGLYHLPTIQRYYRCPDEPVTTRCLFETECNGGSTVRIYGERGLVGVRPFTYGPTTPPAHQIRRAPAIGELPVFDPAWIAGVH
jgi:hypothetical protein